MMSKIKSIKMSKKLFNQEQNNTEVSWDAAIRDAEKMIRKLRVRIAELKVAIKVFEERRDAGEPFPGQEEADQTKSDKGGSR